MRTACCNAVDTTTWRKWYGRLGDKAQLTAAVLKPLQPQRHAHWGLRPELAARVYPGDELVAAPVRSWTHAVEIAAPPAAVWPWIAQIGATRAGFYSYAWLEELCGCKLLATDAVHPGSEMSRGDPLFVHPSASPLHVAGLRRGAWFVAYGAPTLEDASRPRSALQVSWLFFLERLDEGSSRCISRCRVSHSDTHPLRRKLGALALGPLGFSMVRRMLLGLQDRVETASVPARWASQLGSTV